MVGIGEFGKRQKHRGHPAIVPSAHRVVGVGHELPRLSAIRRRAGPAAQVGVGGVVDDHHQMAGQAHARSLVPNVPGFKIVQVNGQRVHFLQVVAVFLGANQQLAHILIALKIMAQGIKQGLP